MASLETHPLRISPNGTTYLRNAEFVTMSDLEKIQYRQNVAATGVTLNGKLQFKLAENTDLTVGGNYSYGNGHGFVYEYALFNPQNNPQSLTNSFRVSARLVQRFNTKTETDKEKSAALITNAVFTLQAEYSKDKSVTQDDDHQANFFDYGYIGKFDAVKGKYNFWSDAGNGYYSNFVFDNKKQAFVQQGLQGDSLVNFTASSKNTTGANFTTDYYNLRGSQVHNFQEIQTGLGLLNGDRPGNIYSLWYNTGRQYNGYSVANNDQFRVYTNFSANIKKHSIQVGFEYQQQIERGFSISPIDLWTLMRQLANSHLTQLDTVNGKRVNTGGPFDYILYNPKYDANTQKQFDKSLRAKLGLGVNNTSFINTDE